MQLPQERVGPYVRALQGCLHRLAPNDDYMPLMAGLAHLRALDPELSGDLLLPAEIDPRTGMPAYAWMERPLAEQRSLGGAAPHTEAAVQRAERLDPELGGRMRARLSLHQHLAGQALLPTIDQRLALRRRSPNVLVNVQYDRVAPDGRWVRLKIDIEASEGTTRLGPLRIDRDVTAHEGLRHFLSRHFVDPTVSLKRELEGLCGGRIVRLSRSWVGPFWFPGVELPSDVPAALGQGLCLQISTDVLGTEVAHSYLNDPLAPTVLPTPEGFGRFQERRFCATGPLVPQLEAWAAGKGARPLVMSLSGAPRARSL